MFIKNKLLKRKYDNKKNNPNSFFKGILVLMFSQVVIKILGLLYKWYLTNKEGFGDYGNAIYSAGFSIYALLLTISSTGVPNAVAKLVSERVAQNDYRGIYRIFKISLFTFALIGLVGTFILFFGAEMISTNWLEIPEAKLSLIALSPAVFFVSINCVFRGYFNGRSDMKATANSQTIEQLFKTILTIIIVEFISVISINNTNMMAASANLATTLATSTSFIYLYLYFRIKRIDLDLNLKVKTYNISNNKISKNGNVLKMIFAILKVSIPMSLTAILISINRNIDSITVKRGLQTFLPELEAIKQYGILSGKVDMLVSLPLSFNIAFATALVPVIAKAKISKNMMEINRKISISILITTIIAIPCMFGLIIFANPILKLLFPNASEGGLILQLSSLSILFMMLNQTINGALQGLGKIFIPAIALSIGVIVKLILNIALIPIPQIGIYGAILATISCHVIACIIGFNSLRKNIKLDLKILNFIVKPFLSAIIMSFCSYFIYIILKKIIIEKVALIVSIFIAITIYVFLLLFLKIFSKKDILSIPFVRRINSFFEK